MDLLKLATQLFMNKLGAQGSALNVDQVRSALGSLLGGSDGQIDLPALISKFGGGDLGGMVSSWLGDGGNQPISSEQVTQALGDANVSAFAGQLGLDTEQASNGLAGMLPDLIDQNSTGGGILDSVGGLSGAMGMASKLFR